MSKTHILRTTIIDVILALEKYIYIYINIYIYITCIYIYIHVM